MYNLASHADYQVEVAAAGAIPPLVALLEPRNSAGVQKQAARALLNIAVNVDNKAKVAAAGGIPPPGGAFKWTEASGCDGAG